MQAECVDAPPDSGHLPGVVECSAALAGSGPRLFMLGLQVGRVGGGGHAGMRGRERGGVKIDALCADALQ